MPKYSYTCRTSDGRAVHGEIEATTYREGVEDVEVRHPDIEAGSVSLEVKESTVKKVAEGAAIGVGCLGIGILQLVMAAIPIAIALLIVFWVLRSCG